MSTRLASLVAVAAATAVSLTAACAARRAAPTATYFGANAAARFDSTRPFSAAVRAGDFLFVSGTLGTDAQGRLVPGGIQPETRQLMENIKATVEGAGATMDRLVKCTAYLVDLREWPAMNEVYVTFFPGPRPARAAVGVKELLFGARVEIECIANVANERRP
jgi:2-iminobutanoate/2-iminopropanoate deaminase